MMTQLALPLTFKRPSSREWRRISSQVFERDHYTCQYCSSQSSLHCDHMTPISRGGSNDISNLVTACVDCNWAKHSKTVEEFLERYAYVRYLIERHPEQVLILRRIWR